MVGPKCQGASLLAKNLIRGSIWYCHESQLSQRSEPHLKEGVHAKPANMSAMTSTFLGNTSTFSQQVAAPRTTGNVRLISLLRHFCLDFTAAVRYVRKIEKSANVLQGKFTTVMRRTVKGGKPGGSAPGTQNSTSWYGPGKQHSKPLSIACNFYDLSRSRIDLS